MIGEQKLLIMNNPISLTESQLNEAYYIIIEQYKSGIISEGTKRAFTYINENTKLDFAFDSTLGLKGKWLCVSEIKVTPEASEE